MLYELLTGEVPYSGDNFVAVAMQHLHEPVPSVLDQRRDVPVRLDLAVQRAMAKDPADRFESMEGLIDELDRCYGELGSDDEATRIVRPPRRPRATRPRRRLPVVPFLLILLAAAAVAGGAYLFFADSPDVPVVAEDNPSGPVRLQAVGAFDPFGDDAEHNSELAEATDGAADDRLAHRGVPKLHQGRRRPRAARTAGGGPLEAHHSSRAGLQGQDPGGEGPERAVRERLG